MALLPNLSTMTCVIAPLLHRCTLTGHYHVQAFVQAPDVRKIQCQKSDRGRARARGLAEARRNASERRRAPTLIRPMRTAGVKILTQARQFNLKLKNKQTNNQIKTDALTEKTGKICSILFFLKGHRCKDENDDALLKRLDFVPKLI